MVQSNHRFRFGSSSALRETASAPTLASSSYQWIMAKVHNNHHPFRSSLAYVGSNFGVTSHVCSRSSQSMRAIDPNHSRNIEPVQSICLKTLQQECHSPQRLEIQSERGSASALGLFLISVRIFLFLFLMEEITCVRLRFWRKVIDLKREGVLLHQEGSRERYRIVGLILFKKNLNLNK